MSLTAAVGISNATDGREAGLHATRQALDQLGRGPVVFGWLIASHTFPIQQVLSGASDLLGDAPLLGFSTSAELTSSGRARRSVSVALLSADDVQARAVDGVHEVGREDERLAVRRPRRRPLGAQLAGGVEVA